MDKVLTLEEAAQYLKLEAPVVKRAAQRKRIPAGKVGGQWRFLRSGLDKFLCTQETTHDVNIAK